MAKRKAARKPKAKEQTPAEAPEVAEDTAPSPETGADSSPIDTEEESESSDPQGEEATPESGESSPESGPGEEEEKAGQDSEPEAGTAEAGEADPSTAPPKTIEELAEWVDGAVERLAVPSLPQGATSSDFLTDAEAWIKQATKDLASMRSSVDSLYPGSDGAEVPAEIMNRFDSMQAELDDVLALLDRARAAKALTEGWEAGTAEGGEYSHPFDGPPDAASPLIVTLDLAGPLEDVVKAIAPELAPEESPHRKRPPARADTSSLTLQEETPPAPKRAPVLEGAVPRRKVKGNDIGEAIHKVRTVRNTEPHNVEVTLQDGSCYVAEFRRDSGGGLPVALVPEVVRNHLRSMFSGKRIFSFD